MTFNAAWFGKATLPKKRGMQDELHRLHAIISAISDAVIVTDRTGRVEFINAQAETLTGHSRIDAMGKPLGAIFRVAHRKAPQILITDLETLSGLTQWDSVAESILHDANGSQHDIEYTFNELRQDGASAGHLLIFRRTMETLRHLQAQEAALERLNTLIEALPDNIIFKDGAGRWMAVNAAAQAMFHLDGLDWQGKTGVELACMQPNAGAMFLACHESDERAWTKGSAHVSLETISMADGQAQHHEVTKIPIFDQSGERRALVIIGRDVSQKVRVDEELNLVTSVFRNNCQEGIMITTAGEDPRIIRINQAFTAITGYTMEEVSGQNPRILKSGIHLPEFYQQMKQCITQNGEWSGEIWDRRKNGEIYPQWLSISSVSGTNDRITHYIASIVDLSQHKSHENRIHQLAFFDALTGLPNRTLLEDRIRISIANAERSKQSLALLFIDLDNFKMVNDSLGHPAGDDLLRMASMRLPMCVREGDTMARLGGDEFVVLLPGFQDSSHASTAAAKVAEKILDTMSQPFWLHDHEIVVTPSIGIAMHPADGEHLSDLIKHADIAMYAAKSSGKNTYRFFAPVMDESAKRRMTIESHLRHALELDEMEMHYQPQVGQDGKIIGAEALLRWHNHELGPISPTEFIPLAEESGSIIAIGEWAIQSVCQQIKLWEQNHLFREIRRVAINISAKQFHKPDFVTRTETIVHAAGVSPSQLELEITESSLMHDIESLKARLAELKAKGYGISVDDFGTGYSSLAYLKHFPIDVLKIDRSFVQDIGMDSYDEAICVTIINLAKNLGLETIAEGVENTSQITFLKTQGCEIFQGYLFGRPVPAGKFTELLQLQHNSDGHSLHTFA